MRSNAFKKFAAVALAVTLIVPMNVGKLNGNVAKAAEAQGKIAFNGDFTTDEGTMDFEGWNGITAGEVKDKVVENVKYSADFEDGVPENWYNLTVVDNVKHNGNKAAKATNEQVIFTTCSEAGHLEVLEAGKEWIVSAWVYSETATVIGVYAPMWKAGWADGELSGDHLTSNVEVKAGEWTLLEHVIPARDSATIIQPRYSSADGSQVYVDDVKVYTKSTAINKKEVTVKSYDFEDGTIEMIQEDSANNKPELSVVKEGENAVLKSHFNSPWMNFFTPDIEVVAGREYTLSWDVKVESVDSESGFFTGMAYPTGNQNAYLDFKADRTKLGEWQKMSIKYTPTGSTVKFAFQLGEQTGVFYYDNIKLTYVEETPVKVVTKDGVVAEGPNGTNALAFAQATDLYNNTLTTVKKGNTYAYSFYAKTVNTEEGFEFKPYVSYGSDNVVELNGKQTGDSEWTKYTGSFVADEIAEGETFKLGFARKGTGDAYVAAVELEETAVEEPTTEAPTTEAPTTEAPTTEAPTTEEPTTEAPTTEAPTTEAPTTVAPTTVAPTTEAPTTTTKKEEVTTTKKPVVTTKKPLDKTKITKKPSKKLSSKKVKVSFKKVKKAKKYTVQFSVTKKFKKVLYTKTVKSTKVTISSSKLKNKKKLYVRVRAVGAKKWSSVVTIKVKK